MKALSEGRIGVLGAGTMGSGIAQVAATAGHPVVLFDVETDALESARGGLRKIFGRLVEKGRVDESRAEEILGRIGYEADFDALAGSALVIEAIVEDLEIKRRVFRDLEDLLDQEAILATNTSSLSVTAIAAACSDPGRVVGAHFFNPAPLMHLVEIVPGLATRPEVTAAVRELIAGWGKSAVPALDTPGFIVNRVARPFYGEALRIYEEGIADFATIDWAMRELGGFRMGPFELMDLIGNDINLKATESVFEAFFYDPRYQPSITQTRMVQANRLGRKTGAGYYDYSPGATRPEPVKDEKAGRKILSRILAMLINGAADAVLFRVAEAEDVDLAMRGGVGYPKGLLEWCDELGAGEVLSRLEALHREYGEDRYRPSALLRRMVRDGTKFFP